MHEVGRRRRTQPAPPHVVFEALTRFDRPGARTWLELETGEQRPRVRSAHAPSSVVWSSPWPDRPDVVVESDLPADGSGGTDLSWALFVDEPVPDGALVAHLRSRLDELINAHLRYSFGQ